MSAKVDGVFRAGVRLSISLAFLKGLMKLEARPEFGIEFRFTSAADLVYSNTTAERHGCLLCMDFAITPFARARVLLSMTVGSLHVDIFDVTVAEVRQEAVFYHLSRHADGNWVFEKGPCDNYLYRQKFRVTEYDTELMDAYITVTSDPYENGGVRVSGNSGATFWLPPGSYTLDVSCPGYDGYSGPLVIDGPDDGRVIRLASLYPTLYGETELVYHIGDYWEDPDGKWILYPDARLSVTGRGGDRIYVTQECLGNLNPYSIRVLDLSAPNIIGADNVAPSAEAIIAGPGMETAPKAGGNMYLQTLTFSPSITEITENAYNSCIRLSGELDLGSVAIIGKGAFFDCRSLASVRLGSTVLQNGGETANRNNEFDCGAFEACAALGSVTGENCSFGDYAFSYCAALSSVSVSGLDRIGERAFQCCYSLREIALPDNLTEIGPYAFTYAGLENVAVPESVTQLGYNVFYGCGELKSAQINGPIRELGGYLFGNCYSLERVTLPESLQTIWSGAFSGCTALEALELPDGVTEIYDSAFSGCTALRSFRIPDGVGAIRSRVFADCYSLRSVTVPVGVRTIQADAFQGCNLTDVYYEGTAEQWECVTNGSAEIADATIHFASYGEAEG